MRIGEIISGQLLEYGINQLVSSLVGTVRVRTRLFSKEFWPYVNHVYFFTNFCLMHELCNDQMLFDKPRYNQ